jgi:hypothetical protein
MLENKISIVITDLQKDEVIAHFNDAKAVISGLLSLTPGQRKGMWKLGGKSYGFAENTYAHAEQHGEFMPTFASMAEFKKDADARKQLYSIRSVAQAFIDNIDDSLMIIGSEEFYTALAYYNSVHQAAKSNVPGAKAIYDDLKKRFPGRAGNPDIPPTPEP